MVNILGLSIGDIQAIEQRPYIYFIFRRYITEILPIRRKPLKSQSVIHVDLSYLHMHSVCWCVDVYKNAKMMEYFSRG